MSLASLAPRLTTTALSAATFAAVLVGSPQPARADGPVTPTGKGIVGGGLLGGEVVCLTMGIVGVERGWPYLVFGGLGAVGGSIGGYFIEQASGTTAEPALYMLAGGLGLVIPTLIVSLNATAYKPPETDRQSEPATNEPSKEPPSPTGTAPTGRAHRSPTLAAAPHVPLSVVDVFKGRVALGVPALELRPLYTAREVWQYGVSQGSEVRMPLFQTTF